MGGRAALSTQGKQFEQMVAAIKTQIRNGGLGKNPSSEISVQPTQPTQPSQPSKASVLYKTISGGKPKDFTKMVKFANQRGFSVVVKALPPGRRGVCDHLNKTITISNALSQGQKNKTMAHELGHMILHNASNKSRAQKEVEAEMVASMVSSKIGVKLNGYSDAYIASWMLRGNIPESALSGFRPDVTNA